MSIPTAPPPDYSIQGLRLWIEPKLAVRLALLAQAAGMPVADYITEKIEQVYAEQIAGVGIRAPSTNEHT